MSFEYIQRIYCVPAVFGGRVEYRGGPAPQQGTITGVDGGHILVKLDGDKGPKRFHPTWEMNYLQGVALEGEKARPVDGIDEGLA